jgi:hypothetical protein
MNIYIDIDNVIARPDNPGHDGPYDYTNVSPIEENIARANALYKAGHRITYYTARGTETGIDWKDVTREQLDAWGCKYYELKMGKPAFDVLIDDKAWNVDRMAEITEDLT